MIFKAQVSLPTELGEGIQPGQSPAVQLLHLIGGHQVVGVKAVQVAQAVPGSVTELQVVLGKLLEDLLGAADVGVIVRGPGPQTDDVGAKFLDQVSGIHTIAQGLVHSPALAVHGPAVGQDIAEGRAVSESAYGGQ